ncbi:MAG TPA: PadR family transcriptional regulator [Solirubrobacteraceae bacterium]|jgi:DNA-binding PadR family transcriptional regulator|nr:PadR family transcriptional regulator [Solirubrobacteraceae bacterium]
MSAKHALLGLLLQRSAYPYELADRLQARLGPAWEINSGQVYQTVRRLEQDGLIEQVDRAATVREDRHVFSITQRGVQEFERWFLSATSGARLSRRPLLVKITLAGPERLRDTLAHIHAYELDCAERLKELSRWRETLPVEALTVRADHVMLRLGLSADIFQLDAELRWARHAHEVVSWLLERDPVWPSARERADGARDESRDRRDAQEALFGRMAARHPAGADADGRPELEPSPFQRDAS